MNEVKPLLLALAVSALIASPPIVASPHRTRAVACPDAVSAPAYRGRLFPPWQKGRNDPSTYRGLGFSVPEVDDLADFHGDPETAQLVIFVGGNYYFAMAPLVHAFESRHPGLKGLIYYETLPPGILLRQIHDQDTITVGNMTWRVEPDVFAAGKRKVEAAIRHGLLRGPVVDYATNDLAIMIPRGNPGQVHSLSDLGRPGVRLAMPNPAWEGVARQIRSSLVKAGGRRLAEAVYGTKVRNGETILTHIHHRQTPLFLMQGLAEAGVTWKSEAIFQEQIGHPIRYVAIPRADNTVAVYAAARVRGSPHPRAARLWLRFLHSRVALHIFEHYGFRPVPHQSLRRVGH